MALAFIWLLVCVLDLATVFLRARSREHPARIVMSAVSAALFAALATWSALHAAAPGSAQ